MTNISIGLLKEEFNLPIEICEDCGGEGEITTFCGHDVQEYCRKCDGKGYITNKKTIVSNSK